MDELKTLTVKTVKPDKDRVLSPIEQVWDAMFLMWRTSNGFYRIRLKENEMTDFEAIKKKNKENAERIRKEREEENKKTKQNYRIGGKK